MENIKLTLRGDVREYQSGVTALRLHRASEPVLLKQPVQQN